MPRVRFSKDPKLPRDWANKPYRKGYETDMEVSEIERWRKRGVIEEISEIAEQNQNRDQDKIQDEKNDEKTAENLEDNQQSEDQSENQEQKSSEEDISENPTQPPTSGFMTRRRR